MRVPFRPELSVGGIRWPIEGTLKPGSWRIGSRRVVDPDAGPKTRELAEARDRTRQLERLVKTLISANLQALKSQSSLWLQRRYPPADPRVAALPQLVGQCSLACPRWSRPAHPGLFGGQACRPFALEALSWSSRSLYCLWRQRARCRSRNVTRRT